MVIVQVDDSRNKEWAKSSIGSKLLKNMGWTEGEGLGRRQQGSSVALRAVRMEENRGIGAKDDDITGSQGWSQTADSFASVLSSLQAEHGTVKKSKKKKKKLVLAKNKVTAGHSRKMREAKDLATKSESDMAAIFGGKVERKKKKRKRDLSDESKISERNSSDESKISTTTNTTKDREEVNEEIDCSDETMPKKKRKKEKKEKTEKKAKKAKKEKKEKK